MTVPVERWLPGPLRVEIHLGAQETAGAFCLLVDHPPAGWSLPPHRHEHEAETVHVVEGAFWMTIGGEHVELGPGQTAHVPRGVLHEGGTLGDVPGRRVLVFSPAGLERFFLEAGTPEPVDAPDVARLLRVATDHGWRFGED